MSIKIKDTSINNIVACTPKGVHAYLCDLMNEYQFRLIVSKKRVTKYGDYRAPYGDRGHRISINQNLNTYSFLLTLIHEISHLIVWNEHKRRVKPHGCEWKVVFRNQMKIIYALNVFPPELDEVIRASTKNPKATVHADKDLAIALRKYDSNSQCIFLDELAQDTVFTLSRGRTFLKGKKLRTRYKCKELESGKNYLFSPLAEVFPV